MSLADPVGPPGATVRHLLSHASGLGPEGDVLAEPEQRRIYSNAGFELVGQELSDRSAIPVERYMHEAVAAPLGMTDTRLEGSPAYGVVSSIGDMAVFAVELMSPRLVSAGTLDEATRVVFPGLPGVLPGFGYMEPNDWGLGFELKAEKSPHWTSPGNSGRTFGHFGALGTFLWVDPDPGLALVVLTDRQFGPWAQRRWPELSSAVLAAAG